MKSVLPEGCILHRRYRVGRVLGIGGFGITYAAYDSVRREWMALKEYFPDEWAERRRPGNQIVPTGGQRVCITSMEKKFLSKKLEY